MEKEKTTEISNLERKTIIEYVIENIDKLDKLVEKLDNITLELRRIDVLEKRSVGLNEIKLEGEKSELILAIFIEFLDRAIGWLDSAKDLIENFLKEVKKST